MTLLTLQNEPLPACGYEDLPTPHTALTDWQRTLLDPLYHLPESYAPDDLEPVSNLGLPGDYRLRKIVMDDLEALLAAARDAGHALEFQSAYRSYNYQAKTFDYWVEQLGRAAALKSSARAGHSEHQLGTVADFRSAGGRAPWDVEDWAETPAGAWLERNAHLYGWVMSYPKGRESVTCYIYEPWHYRYVGREAASEIRERGITLREWLWERQ